MKPRSHLPQREANAGSRQTKTVHEQQLIAGSLVTTKQTCGKPNCRCKRGRKHDAGYVALKYKGKRRMFRVAPDRREQVKSAVEAYKQARRLLETMSEHCCERLLNKGS